MLWMLFHKQALNAKVQTDKSDACNWPSSEKSEFSVLNTVSADEGLLDP